MNPIQMTLISVLGVLSFIGFLLHGNSESEETIV